MSEEKKPNNPAAVPMAASNILKQAQEACLLALVVKGLQQAGVNAIDGLSLTEWYYKRLPTEIERVLLAMEDVDPAIAATMQAYLDRLSDGKK